MVRAAKFLFLISAGGALVAALAGLRPLPAVNDAESVLAAFLAETVPAEHLDLSPWPDEASAALLDPQAALPASARFAPAPLRRLVRYAETCRDIGNADDPALAKAWTGHRYRCGARTRLPADFFERPPYLHPSGASYAELARKAGLALHHPYRFLHAGELAASGFAMASDATYELHRVTVSGNGTADKSEINCQITSGQIQHLSKVSGIASSQSGAFTTDEATVQKLADEAVGLNRLDLDSAKNYTAWLVRANADEPFKVVRANVDGRGYQEPSPASKTIAVFMGENCYRVFGQ